MTTDHELHDQDRPADETFDAVLEAPFGPPLTYPLPRPTEDPRFTQGLSIDVAKVLAQHGYPQITEGMDLLRLQGALFGFLYEEADGEHAC